MDKPRDGERVKAGQALVELDSTSATADKTTVEDQLKASVSDVLRSRVLLQALQSGEPRAISVADIRTRHAKELPATWSATRRAPLRRSWRPSRATSARNWASWRPKTSTAGRKWLRCGEGVTKLETHQQDERANHADQSAGGRFLKTAIRFTVALSTVMQLTACSKAVQWEEEVRLNDGRVIVVTQKKRCEGEDYKAKTKATCVARESWLTFRLPEFSDKDIVWHESLKPMVLNVHQTRLYVIGRAPTTLEFRAYGATNPPYFGFRWTNGSWVRIPFNEIPVAIYDGNMLIENIPSTQTKFLRLTEKNSPEENGNPVYPAYLRRIDPQHMTSAY